MNCLTLAAWRPRCALVLLLELGSVCCGAIEGAHPVSSSKAAVGAQVLEAWSSQHHVGAGISKQATTETSVGGSKGGHQSGTEAGSIKNDLASLRSWVRRWQPAGQPAHMSEAAGAGRHRATDAASSSGAAMLKHWSAAHAHKAEPSRMSGAPLRHSETASFAKGIDAKNKGLHATESGSSMDIRQHSHGTLGGARSLRSIVGTRRQQLAEDSVNMAGVAELHTSDSSMQKRTAGAQRLSQEGAHLLDNWSHARTRHSIAATLKVGKRDREARLQEPQRLPITVEHKAAAKDCDSLRAALDGWHRAEPHNTMHDMYADGSVAGLARADKRQLAASTLAGKQQLETWSHKRALAEALKGQHVAPGSLGRKGQSASPVESGMPSGAILSDTASLHASLQDWQMSQHRTNMNTAGMASVLPAKIPAQPPRSSSSDGAELLKRWSSARKRRALNTTFDVPSSAPVPTPSSATSVEGVREAPHRIVEADTGELQSAMRVWEESKRDGNFAGLRVPQGVAWPSFGLLPTTRTVSAGAKELQNWMSQKAKATRSAHAAHVMTLVASGDQATAEHSPHIDGLFDSVPPASRIAGHAIANDVEAMRHSFRDWQTPPDTKDQLQARLVKLQPSKRKAFRGAAELSHWADAHQRVMKSAQFMPA